MMELFHLPPELMITIFEAIALSRSFKRLMRLRLVSRLCRDVHPLYLEHLVHQATVARMYRCRFGRIRRTGMLLCQMAGNTRQDALVETLRSLCSLSFRSDPSWFLRKQFSRDRSSGHTEPPLDDLQADLCVAAIYLGHHAHGDLQSEIFGSAFIAATLGGDVSIILMLLSSNPNYNASEAIPFNLRKRLLTHAAWFGHRDAFDFAIDSGPLGVNKGEIEICKYTSYVQLSPEYALLLRGAKSTPIIDNYRRGTALLLPHNSTTQKDLNEDLKWALGNNASEGHTDMVRYLLDSDTSPIPNRKRTNEALLKAGANPNKFSRLHTPLMYAAWTSSTTIAKLLLESGALPNVGRSPPIALAVAKEDEAMFRLLWEDEVLYRCPERRELAQLSWYLFLSQKDIAGDRDIAEILRWDDAISAV
ncbi:ankyrin repeat-containing domain protein [Xylaria cf. heliscus]|nr:ankyrin repeat-containing domain protein [Xylaria cf. heliscus]